MQSRSVRLRVLLEEAVLQWGNPTNKHCLNQNAHGTPLTCPRAYFPLPFVHFTFLFNIVCACARACVCAAASEVGPDQLGGRTSTIVDEGLKETVRKSAVLGVGKGTMRSYGVADNFQYSCYDPAYRAPSPPDSPGAPIGGSSLLSRSGLSSSASSLPGAGRSVVSSSSVSRRDDGSGSPSLKLKPPRDPTIGHSVPAPVSRTPSSASVLST